MHRVQLVDEEEYLAGWFGELGASHFRRYWRLQSRSEAVVLILVQPYTLYSYKPATDHTTPRFFSTPTLRVINQ